jgi:replicative DNA helicase
VGEPANPEILLISAIVQTGDLGSLEGITQEHFHTHRNVFSWIEDFAMRFSKAPDKATFRAQFPDFPLLRTTDVEYAAEEVEQAHLRYTLTSMFKGGITKLTDNQPHEALSLVSSSLAELNRSSFSNGGHTDALRDYQSVLAEAERRIHAAQTLGYAGLSYGFRTLDDRTGGLHPGDLAIWAARLGQGKTWYLCKVVTQAILAGKKAVFVSLEQTRSQIIFRIHTLLARELGYSLRHRDLMQGTNMDVDYYRSFLVKLPELVSGALIVSDPTRGRVTPFTLASLMDRHDPDLMLIDYLTLMTQGDEWQDVARTSKETKLLATQYDVPILAAAQINREGDGGRRPPSAKHLAKSDSIGQDADVIVTMKKESESVVQGLLAKNRSGQDGQVFWSVFKPNEGRIEEVAHDEALTLISMDGFDDD